MRVCLSFLVVENMRIGLRPMDACVVGIKRLLELEVRTVFIVVRTIFIVVRTVFIVVRTVFIVVRAVFIVFMYCLLALFLPLVSL